MTEQERKDEVPALAQATPEVGRARYHSPVCDTLPQKEFTHKFGPHATLFIEHVGSAPRVPLSQLLNRQRSQIRSLLMSRLLNHQQSQLWS